MKSKIILIASILILSMAVSFVMQFFVWPRLSVTPFFAKYELGKNNKKTIVINKTEKITVKEDFSLANSAEKIIPAVAKIYFLPEVSIAGKKIELNTESATGVVLAGDGVIVTVLPEFSLSNRVIKVFLADGQEFVAKIKNKDTFNGLLILKIEADNLPVVPFGESDNLNNGEKLILVGQAMFDNKPIFALRAIQEYSNNFSKKGTKFLFSDENSEVFILDNVVSEQFVGGAAVDFNGTIIGLINNVRNIDGENSVIIPFENVKKSVENAFNQTNKEDNIFGAYYLNINEKLSISNELSVDQGALIYSPSGKNGLAVLTKSIGQEAGLKIYDIITNVNEIKIDDDNTLSDVLRTQDLNGEIRIKIIRNGKSLELIKKAR